MREARGLPAEEVRRGQGRSRHRLHAEQLPVRDRVLRHLRIDAVVVPISPMNLADELKKYVNDCGAKVMVVAQELWPQAAPLAIDHVIVAAYSDYLQKPTDLKVPDAFKQPRQAIAAPNVTLWSDAMAAGLTAGPAHRRPRRPRAACRTPRAPPAIPRDACTRTAR